MGAVLDLNRERQRRYYQNHKEEIRAKQRQAYQENKHGRKEYQLKYAAEHREERRQYQAERYKKIGAQQREKQTKQRRSNRVAFLLREAKYRATEKGLEFSITQSDVSIPEHCPVLGIPLSLDCRGRPGPGSPSLDRIDSSRGYVPGNVVVISWRANRLKSDATVDELRKIVQWLEGKI